MNVVTQTILIDPTTDTPVNTSMTIADAMRIVAGWTDLPAGRLQKFKTALATAARALAPAHDTIFAAAQTQLNCQSLSRLLQAAPATFGLSQGRMYSLCSELRAILRRLGEHEPDNRGDDLRSAKLITCRDLLPAERQRAVIDFLRFLDTEEIAPEDADGATLAAYQERCATRTLCADPAARACQAATNWNWACQTVPHWPGQPLIRTDRTDRYSFPLSTYPASFQQDVDRYVERLRGTNLDDIFADDIFGEDDGRASRFQRPLRPASITSRVWMIRCAAGALVITGVAQTQVTSLRDLVHPPERVKTIMRYFLNRVRGGKPSPMASRIAQTLLLVARDHCRLPEAEISAIATWGKRIKMPAPTGLTEKNMRRLRALMEPRARAMLLWFPRELMRRAADPALSPPAAARLAMYAVAMEILLVCPMRRKNLAELRVDRHLYRPDPRLRALTHLLISADEVKNNTPIEWELPKESARLIEHFLTRHRPHLVEPGNPYLFGTGTTIRSAQHLGEWLAGKVTQAIGVEFNVHLARHFSAWNFLRMNPGQYEIVRQVLGHASIDMTIRYYVGLEADSAAKHFDATVLRDRHALRHMAQQAYRERRGPSKPPRGIR